METGEAIPQTVRERLQLIEQPVQSYGEAQNLGQLEQIREGVWQSNVLQHFDKRALEPVYFEREREIVGLRQVMKEKDPPE